MSKKIFAAAATVVAALMMPAMASAATYDLPIGGVTGDGMAAFQPVGGGYLGHEALVHTGSAGDPGRIFWVVPDAVGPNPVLVTIQWWGANGADGNAYQPFESQYDGLSETFPIDPNIPWAGAFGTNHQYISNNAGPGVVGQFNATGPGPHTPQDATFTAGPNGTQMWLRGGSEIYVKWDFGFYSNTTNVLSDLLITTAPEPASLSLLAVGAGGLLIRRRRVC